MGFNEDFFHVHIHHGGIMKVDGNVASYEGGSIDEFTCDGDRISLTELIQLVELAGKYGIKFGDNERLNLSIWYVVPGKTLGDGRKMVFNDVDAMEMARLACGLGNGNIHVYVEHGVDDPTEVPIEDVVVVVEDQGPSQAMSTQGISEGQTLGTKAEKLPVRRKEVPVIGIPSRESPGANEGPLGQSPGEKQVPISQSLRGKQAGQRRSTRSKHVKKKDIADEELMDIEDESSDKDDGALSEGLYTDSDEEVIEILQNEKKRNRGNYEFDSIFWGDDRTYEGGDMSEEHMYMDSDDEAGLCHSDEEDCNNINYPTFNPRVDMPNIKSFELVVGMLFKDDIEFRRMLVHWSLKRGHGYKWVESGKKVCAAKCTWEGCEWRIRASMDHKKEGFQIKTVGPEHNCPRVYKNKIVGKQFITEMYADRILNNPSMSIANFQQEIKKDFEINVSYRTVLRARTAAMTEVTGVVRRQYARIRDYGMEILRSNPGSTVDISTPGDPPQFNRIYICFKTLRDSFLAGCRRVLCLDGAFLKGISGGEVLTAVGVDGNNQMYPVVWAVVTRENYENWAWFITHLQSDLDLGNGSGWTVMTDQQKGLELAIREILPEAEHRECARHIYSNWKKIYGGRVFQSLFWSLAKAPTEAQWNAKMEEIKLLDADAYDSLLKKDKTKFCKAFFQTETKCDIYDNNMAEAFNKCIVDARRKPIITMLEEIRLIVMERFGVKRKGMGKWEKYGKIAPRIRKKFDAAVYESRNYESIWCTDDEYQVTHNNGIGYCVDLKAKTCSCRVYDLTGIPCEHVISAVNYAKLLPEDFIAPWYKLNFYEKAYERAAHPVKGKHHWLKTSTPDVEPPPPRKKMGRLPFCRRKDKGKKQAKDLVVVDDNGVQKLKKVHVMRCLMCKQQGHNSRGCPMNKKSSNESLKSQPKKRGKGPLNRSETNKRGKKDTNFRDNQGASSSRVSFENLPPFTHFNIHMQTTPHGEGPHIEKVTDVGSTTTETTMFFIPTPGYQQK